jgi:hypothetical protein
MPANEVAFGFRCTRRTSLLELTTTRLAEGLRADRSLAPDELVTMVRDEIERSRNLPVNMGAPPKAPRIHVIITELSHGTFHLIFYADGRRPRNVRYQEINDRRIPLPHRPGHPSPPSDRVERVGPMPPPNPRVQDHWGQSPRHPGLVAALIHLKQVLGALH